MSQNIFSKKIAIIGLGYVGLPLLMSFSKKFDVIGYDINLNRINEIKKGTDSYNEYQIKKNLNYKNCKFTNNFNKLENIDIFIVTVPTPVYKNNKPNLRSLKVVSKNIGRVIKKNAIVVFESTVYPGATEEVCVPIIAKNSGMKYNKDFFCGYSPERINPGDKKRKLKDIVKVVSGSNKKTTNSVNKLYKSIIQAGTYIAPSIRVAEASKIIENVQRDVNISLVNEFALIFEKLNLDTKEVLDAASTKWNFLNFKPGLVGGHCIGVDPYYLAYKASKNGYKPKVLLNGRKVNNSIPKSIVKSIEKKAKQIKLDIKSAKILILGLTFKENCSDIRNSRVIDLIKEFKKVCGNISIHDSFADKELLINKYKIKLLNQINDKYDIVILAVAHQEYLKLDFSKILRTKYILYDVKSVLPKNISTLRL